MSIESFETEWQEHCNAALGSVILGDLNLHHKGWLRYSSRNSTEGALMRKICNQYGFRQLVHESTRESNLLDLVITDIEGVKVKVLPGIADHKAVLATLTQKVPQSKIIRRRVWTFWKADWDGLRERLRNTCWDQLSELTPDEGVKLITDGVLDAARACIPQHVLRERKSTHPWMNDEVQDLVRKKHAAVGTSVEYAARDACSRGMMEAFSKYVQDERERLYYSCAKRRRAGGQRHVGYCTTKAERHRFQRSRTNRNSGFSTLPVRRICLSTPSRKRSAWGSLKSMTTQQ